MDCNTSVAKFPTPFTSTCSTVDATQDHPQLVPPQHQRWYREYERLGGPGTIELDVDSNRLIDMCNLRTPSGPSTTPSTPLQDCPRRRFTVIHMSCIHRFFPALFFAKERSNLGCDHRATYAGSEASPLVVNIVLLSHHPPRSRPQQLPFETSYFTYCGRPTQVCPDGCGRLGVGLNCTCCLLSVEVPEKVTMQLCSRRRKLSLRILYGKPHKSSPLARLWHPALFMVALLTKPASSVISTRSFRHTSKMPNRRVTTYMYRPTSPRTAVDRLTRHLGRFFATPLTPRNRIGDGPRTDSRARWCNRCHVRNLQSRTAVPFSL